MIYFDNSATTVVNQQVLATHIKVTEDIWGNPSSLHNLGNKAASLLNQARKQIAEVMQVQPSEIYFTSGGTEGDNWAIKGTAIEKREFGRHIILSAIEHPAVKESAKQLELLGFDITYLPVGKDGRVTVEALAQAIRPDTILVSIMAINNEVGTIQPIAEIGHLLENYPRIHFHVDAVQAVGKMDLALGANSRIDIATFSGHKFHALRGTGFLYLKKGRRIAPLLSGGGQESNGRSGTENVAGIAAMAKALRLIRTDETEKIAKQREIHDFLHQQLEQLPNVVLFSGCNQAQQAPHILCFALKGIRGEVMVHALEKEAIYLSTTSACSSKSKATSSTLGEMNVPTSLAECAVRLSLSDESTMTEAKQFIQVFQQLCQTFSGIHS
ncbi:cysteine desulfurase family protein [Isobaculum melis]|uniref:Cysteine desulfurase n=1 Tax=Isobaculum melis TaxID=142588 RepID=A0A1H9RMY4_9LACT|nr:cysteine desulfurase family protein [Isobaculum melis]SER73299.1 cysteine desulfurase [Isobaculum melis]